MLYGYDEFFYVKSKVPDIASNGLANCALNRGKLAEISNKNLQKQIINYLLKHTKRFRSKSKCKAFLFHL